jgi:hypothetical protein
MNRDKGPAELYQERLKRVEDAIHLKVPDRIPVYAVFNFFPAKYAGITCEEAFYDHDKWIMANRKAILDFEPDTYRMANFSPGPTLEALKCKQIKWPGHGVSPDHTFQFLQGDSRKPLLM